MFEPEKVDHWYTTEEPCVKHPHGAYVKARDYDQLLELYRKALSGREAYAKGLMTMRQPAVHEAEITDLQIYRHPNDPQTP